jgi:hypothetical protein
LLRNTASAGKPNESSAYIKLNIPTPCPPRSAVPGLSRHSFNEGGLTQGRCLEFVSTRNVHSNIGQGCDHSGYVSQEQSKIRLATRAVYRTENRMETFYYSKPLALEDVYGKLRLISGSQPDRGPVSGL